MRMSKVFSTAFYAGMVLGLAAVSAPAATMTWSSVVSVTGNPTDVDTTGLFFDSAASTTNSVGGDLVVNGVDFHRPIARVGDNNTFFSSGITIQSDDPPLDGFGGGATFGGDYGTLLSYGQYHHNRGDAITITGLALATDYEVQIWTPYWTEPDPTVYTAGNSSASVYTGVTPSRGSGEAQYVIGTFTADATSEVINYDPGAGSPNNYAFISAIQVRALPVPEPTSIALLVLGALMMLRLRR